MKLIRNAVALSVVASAVALAACSGQTGSTGTSGQGSTVGSIGEGTANTGTVGMHLLIAAGVHVNALSWTITNGTNTYTGVINITDDAGNEAQSVEFVAGGIVAGAGYKVTLTGTDSNGDFCNGTSAAVTVSAGATSAAVVNVTCTVASDAATATTINTGNIAVDAGVTLVNQAPFVCPAISGVSISPAEVKPPETAGLTALTTGGAGGTNTLVWSATCGTGTPIITNPNSASATFACGTAINTTCTVTLTVGLNGTGTDGGSVGQVCTNVANTTTVETIVCEPGGIACAPGQTACSGTCVTTSSDVNNCGGCGIVCPAGDTCNSGTCVVPPPQLCTAAPCPANSIKCDGTTSGVCTPEEQIIANKDLAAGRFTGTQLNKSGTNRSCYECLVSAGCVDTNTNHGSECGDLTGTISGGASAGKTLAQACLDTVTCIEGSTFSPGNQFPGTTTGTCADDSNNGVLNCFCGPALDDSSTCNAAAASSDNGACLATEYAGFGTTNATSNSVILGEYTDTTTASGMANNLFQCAGANSGAPSCPQCF